MVHRYRIVISRHNEVQHTVTETTWGGNDICAGGLHNRTYCYWKKPENVGRRFLKLKSTPAKEYIKTKKKAKYLA